ncbi:selenide, water dikinase SelD [Amphritea balenae]|uniref:Selenide, water dikinase n=1 Tax=Amphritea balenae TaxID=452629 RepID=A0A3P1SV74_9GAMM|nr:selenide, water dikinase SelD [Amphritea balenae]RRD01010.1 selenide, water dikinase SelD [Amphritea balenae]GGK60774.1 selenide, water dikinase [Amphritea balenae]
MSDIKLTAYSHGAGCGCKISPAVLKTILQTDQPGFDDPKLLVGNQSSDDAAVYDIGNGQALISTTDFFMPIVDDPYDFGRVAAANAISDIYAMGGKPVMAIAILAWPVNLLAPEIAQQVLEGGRAVCRDAGIALAGGHSIDAPEPIFGLAVTGTIATQQVKRNNSARGGAKLYLTKPIGVGILTTAKKQDKLSPEHERQVVANMTTLNKIGNPLSEIEGVSAITDVTGFGLMGHLLEICEGSDLAATIDADAVPLLEGVDHYLDQGCIPGGSLRNFDSYGSKIAPMTERQQRLFCDPQTSGGLLVAVDSNASIEVEALGARYGLELQPIGELKEYNGDYRIELVDSADL